MSLIRSVKLSKLCLKNNAVLFTAVRNHWNKDFKPGPYPKTQAERIAAAKKYDIPIEEYEPYPDDGTGNGDYPKLPYLSVESRNPFYPWDNPELKRNFNETVHADYELLREDRVDVSAKLRHPLWVYWAQFLGTMAGLWIIYDLFDKIKMFPAVTPRQYPDKTHYTFEMKD